MINLTKILTIMVALSMFFVFGHTIIEIIPWYSQENPMRIRLKSKVYKPGEFMGIQFKRRALVGFQARVTRELVRIHSNIEEEVFKITLDVSIDRGSKEVGVTYKLPTLELCPNISGNTYFWRGSMKYKPFGLVEKTYFFRTEPFQLEIPKKEKENGKEI